MADFTTREVTPATLFEGDHFYRIPSYQRPFSWDDDHFEDLISDTTQANWDENYFIGTVVFHKTSNGIHDIVDGQQRFTALMILFACIRDLLDEAETEQEMQDLISQKGKKLKGIPERVRLQVKDREIFNSIVVQGKGTVTLPDYDHLSEAEYRYIVAVEIFREFLLKMDRDRLSSYATFLMTKCQFIYLSASTFKEAFRLFEVVNDRGKQLRRIDVLKAKNISPDFIADEEQRERTSQDWERAEEDIGENAFEEVFFLMRLAMIKDKPKGDLLFEFEERIFEGKLALQGEPFVDLVLKYVELYRALFIDRSALDGTEFETRFGSLIYVMDNEFRASEWRACVLLYLKKFNKDELLTFLLAIERLYLTHSVNGVRKDERYKDYTKILRLIDDSSTPSAVISEIGGSEEAVKSALKQPGMYGRNYTKYALLRLELNSSDFEKEHLYDARSIEHVFPQTPKEGGDWYKGYTEAEREQFVNKLGNLVLLSKSKNSSASNKEFNAKKRSYLDPRVSSYPQSMKVLGYETWTREAIEERTELLAESFFAEL